MNKQCGKTAAVLAAVLCLGSWQVCAASPATAGEWLRGLDAAAGTPTAPLAGEAEQSPKRQSMESAPAAPAPAAIEKTENTMKNPVPPAEDPLARPLPEKTAAESEEMESPVKDSPAQKAGTDFNDTEREMTPKKAAEALPENGSSQTESMDSAEKRGSTAPKKKVQEKPVFLGPAAFHPQLRIDQPAGTDTVGWPYRFVAAKSSSDRIPAPGVFVFRSAAGEPRKRPQFQGASYNLIYRFRRDDSSSFVSAARPLRVDADWMKYNSRTGDMSAAGNVDMYHLQDMYQTELVYGNTIQRQYTIPEKLEWTSPIVRMTADSGVYDGSIEEASFISPRGYYGTYYINAEKGVFYQQENKAIFEKAYITTRSAVAKTPDYRIEANWVEVYPNDHYTAHHASLYFKNVRLLTVQQFSGSLKKDDSNVNMWSLIPRPSYDSDNGFGLKNSITIPLAGRDDLDFYARLGWFTKEGFKPDIGVRWDTDIGSFKLRYAKEESSLNDDHIWVEKKPELSFSPKNIPIAKTGLYIGSYASMGRWYEGRAKGSHMLWDTYISGPSIQVGPKASVWWRAGYRKDYYGYNDVIRRNGYYAMGLNTNPLPWLNAWVSYTDNDLKGRTPYSFDTYDTEKPLDFGYRVRLTRLDSVAVAYTLRTTDGKLEHLDYIYYRDMHSFSGWIKYRQKDKETQIYIQPKDFKF